MTVNLKKSKLSESDQLQKIAAGTQKYLANLPEIMVLGKLYKPADLATQLQDYGTTVGKYELDKQDLTTERETLKILQPTIRAMVNAVHGVAEAAFGTTSSTLTEFGFTPAKVKAPKTGATMVATATKAKSTRKSLGTLGSKQKKAAIVAAHNQQIVDAAQAASASAGEGPSSSSSSAASSAPASSSPGTGVVPTTGSPNAAGSAAQPSPAPSK